MPNDPDERMKLAERWRLLGEELRERSPVKFEKLVEMLAAFETDDEDEEQENIDAVYLVH